MAHRSRRNGSPRDTAIRSLGVDRLVYGSDRPVVEPIDPGVLGDDVAHALLEHNPLQVLGPVAVAA